MTLKDIFQWLGIIIVVGSAWVSLRVEVAEVRASLTQEMKGYQAMVNAVTSQRNEILVEMNLMESRLTQRIERIEDRMNRRIP